MNARDRIQSTKPVVALDIDGTSGDYHGHFLRFAEGYIGRPMPNPREINPGEPLHKFMKVNKTTYRECKLAYRQGGMKRSMPAYEGVAEASRLIRRAGAELWICTTRPYLRLDNIDPDTREWLRRNGIQYDAVIYGERKYHDLAKLVGPQRVIRVLEDLPELIDQAQRLGFTTLMKDQPYNQHFESARFCDFMTFYPLDPDPLPLMPKRPAHSWGAELVNDIKRYRKENS